MNKFKYYKNKYILIKNNILSGGFEPTISILNCDESVSLFQNRIGSCAIITILMSFLFSDKLSSIVQNKLLNIDFNRDIRNNELLDFLLNSIYNNFTDIELYEKKIDINNFIDLIKTKFLIKLRDFENKHRDTTSRSELRELKRNNKLQRTKSYITEKHIEEYKDIIFGKINNQSIYISEIHLFFLWNILSSIFLDKLITIYKYNTDNNMIIKNKILKNAIVVNLSFLEHTIVFYKCNGKYKLADNNNIIDYRWDLFFIKYNELIQTSSNFTFISKYNYKKGPVIIFNKKIYFYYGKEEIQMNIELYLKEEKLYDIFEHIFNFKFILEYNHNIINFKKNHFKYYYMYYFYYDMIDNFYNLITDNDITNIKINYDITPLLFIISKDDDYTENQIIMIKYLLDNPNANINLKNNNGENALIQSCFILNYKMIELLVDNPNTDVNIKDKFNKTPLQNAYFDKDYRIINLLLSNDNTDVNIINQFGDTLLHNACYNKDYIMIELLLSNCNIDVNIKNKVGNSPLIDLCSVYNRHDIIQLLLNKGNIDVKIQNNKGYTALMYVCCSNNDDKELIELLLNKEIIYENIQDNISLLDLQDENGYTALMHACINKNYNIIELLLTKQNIDVNLQDEDGYTALIHTCLVQDDISDDDDSSDNDNDDENDENYDNQLINLLLSNDNIDVNLQDRKGFTALMHLCIRKNYRIIKLLLNNDKTDVNITDNDGNTLLQNACDEKDYRIIKLLLSNNKTELNFKNKEGMTAYDIAIENDLDSSILRKLK